eukprot:TRINITY_DN3985_c0_g1_i1.p1 TRINITY_DN3985_c0_g1~~TRINITY_DN3985_c0_g1_i1.p1  ORF type:complete len:550 (-),score=66.66 TRINITY_DN3985_c0_g1_i1:381-1976(-)
MTQAGDIVKTPTKDEPTTSYLHDFARLLRLTWPLLLGNTLEWYEFGVYGYVEKEIAANFFGDSSFGGWMGYAITFAARPVGGVLLGWVADNWGRKLSVNLSLAGMIVGTVGQGLIPGKYWGGEFQSLGLVLLILTRALQGLSAGGEIGAISCYMMEVSPIQTLGTAVCMISVGSQVAWAFASGFMAFLNMTLGVDAMLMWGWRVPFLVCVFPGALALWGRNQLQESDVFLEEVAGTGHSDAPRANDEEAGRESANSAVDDIRGESANANVGIVHLFTKYWPNMLISFGATVGIATMWFVPPFWTLTAILDEHLGSVDSLLVGNSAQIFGLAVTPIAGLLADKIGVARTLFHGAVFFAVTGFPVYTWISFHPDRLSAYLGVGCFYGMAQGFSGAIIFLFVAELFPAKIRGQGIAFSYNLAVSYIGGFGAMICEALFQVSPHYAPGLWFSATGAVSAVTILVAVLLQRRGLVQLTHRRSAPYFGRSMPKEVEHQADANHRSNAAEQALPQTSSAGEKGCSVVNTVLGNSTVCV